MAFCLLQRRATARRGMIGAVLMNRCPLQSFLMLTRSYSNKLFVGGLSFRTDEEAVRRAFGQHGEVVEVRLISDRETGRPKGFGFITFQTEAEAETARTKMTGQLLDGRVIRVDKAAARTPPPSNYGGGSGSAGGFGGMNTSSASSNLPPVSEDWGTIPSNVFKPGQSAATAAPTAPATAPVATNTAFGAESVKPFDSSSFGQAASWSSSTPAPSNAQDSTFSSSTFGSATSAVNHTVGLSTATSPSSSPSRAWTSSTSATTSATGGQSSSFNSSTFGSAATAVSSSSFVSASTSVSNVQAPSNPSTAFGGTMADVKAFDSSTFGAAMSTTASYGANTTKMADVKVFDSSTSGATTSITASYGTNTTMTSSGSASVDSTSSRGGDATATNNTSTMGSTATSTSTTVASTISTASTTAATGTTIPFPDTSKPSQPDAAVQTSTITASTTPDAGPPSAHPLNSPALTSTGKFDLSNFSFNSSSYRESEPPLPRRRPRPRPRPNMSTTTSSDFNSSTASILETRSPFGSNNQFAETSIPKPKGPEFDFGLLNITAPCPEGFRPQGVFDIYIPDDLPEIPPPEPKPKPEKPTSLLMFPHRQLPALDLPYDTPGADNWSEIGSDPPKYDLSSLFPSMGEIIKKEKELHWDPYDFDEEAKAVLPIEEERIIMESDYDEPFR